jgi:serine protease inhibitor
MMEKSAAPGSDIPTMRIDRPYILAIKENHSGTILFMGKIAEPVWE